MSVTRILLSGALLLGSVAPAVGQSVVINEFMARNNSGIVDEAGQFEDWIELYNPGAAAVDLSGWYLSDDSALPAQWPIPAGTVLDAGGFLLVWADNDPLDGPMHANFKLAAAGEEVLLVAPDGVTVVDAVSFGLQQPDIATGNLRDGLGPWVSLLDPTPGGAGIGVGGVRHYDALDQTLHSGRTTLTGDPRPGQSVQLELSFFPSAVTLSVGLGSAPLYDEIMPGVAVLLVQADILTLPITTDASGNASVPFQVPNQASLVGRAFYAQAGQLGANVVASNAIEVVVR